MQGKHVWGRLILILIVAAAAGAGLWAYRHAKAGQQDERITSIQVSRGPIEEIIEATGYVAPLNRVEIKPAVSGRIENLLVDESDRVKAGQILAQMSSADRVAILDAARSQGPDVYDKWQKIYLPIPIVSPLAGTIILKNVVIGQTVDPSTVIYAISDRLIVYAQVDETDIGRIKDGMDSRITLDAYPNKVVPGKVFDILQEGVNTNNVITYNVKIDPIEGAPAFFSSQMTANIDFVLNRKTDAPLIPAVAVTQKHGKFEVQVPGPDGNPEPREVTLGIQGADNDEIVDGLKEGDTVLIVEKHYTPQQAAQSSPLAGMGGGHGGGGHH